MAIARNPQALDAVLDAVYPVGSILTWVPVSGSSVDLSTADKVAAHYGGTWEAYGGGRMLLGASAAHPAAETGGEETHTHDLGSDGWATIGNYSERIAFQSSNKKASGHDNLYTWTHENDVPYTSDMSHYTDLCFVQLGGKTNAVQTMPPYITVYRWRRIA